MITVAASTSAGSTDALVATTPAINTTTATLIVLSVGYAGAVPTISDSLSNIWLSSNVYIGAGVSNALYYCFAPTVGAAHTFTITTVGGAGFPSIAVLALAGAAVNHGPDLNYGANGVNPIAATPGWANEIIITGISDFGTGPTVAGGFTIPPSASVDAIGGLHYGTTIAYQIQTGTTPKLQQPVWTVSNVGGVTVASFLVLPSPWSTLQSGSHANLPPASTQPDQAFYEETDYGIGYQNQGGSWVPQTMFGAPYYLPAAGQARVPLGIMMFWAVQVDSDEPTAVFLDVSGYLSESSAGI